MADCDPTEHLCILFDETFGFVVKNQSRRNVIPFESRVAFSHQLIFPLSLELEVGFFEQRVNLVEFFLLVNLWLEEFLSFSERLDAFHSCLHIAFVEAFLKQRLTHRGLVV
mmetsp:Transcript_14373/g.19468  ORF Transcript_14373/g.19468 Transcript_14373/m.19468 type:complete len:111 (+) Transcript_14373:1760-2092(+)